MSYLSLHVNTYNVVILLKRTNLRIPTIFGFLHISSPTVVVPVIVPVVMIMRLFPYSITATTFINTEKWVTTGHTVGAVVQLVEYRTRNREVAGSTHTRSTASNLEQDANLLCAQANSASYPQRDGK